MSKTKFNGFENHFIIESLKSAIEESEEEISLLISQGKRPIFAEGYFELVGGELITKINNMTLKRDRKDLQK